MMILVSYINECSYTLDSIHQTVLIYHPLYSDGRHETNRGAYADVEWDELDDDALQEADECYQLLKRSKTK